MSAELGFVVSLLVALAGFVIFVTALGGIIRGRWQAPDRPQAAGLRSTRTPLTRRQLSALVQISPRRKV